MSYSRNCASGYGAYYELGPHEVLSGFGATTIRQSFNAAQVWADAQHGGEIGKLLGASKAGGCGTAGAAGSGPMDAASCAQLWKAQGAANAAGGRAAKAIQEALNELGYGPVSVDSTWGGQTKAAWERFCADQNLPSGPGLVNEQGLMKMEQLLRGGAAPGPQKGGLPGWGWALLAAAGVAAVVVISRRNKGGAPSSSRSLVPVR